MTTGKIIVNKSATKGSMPSFSVRMLVASLSVAHELAGRYFSNVFPETEVKTLDPSVLIPALIGYQEVVNDLLSKGSRVEVRFLGDLKEHSYGPEILFFSATKDAGDDFPHLLRSHIMNLRSKGGGTATLVNLANVREIKVHVGKDVNAVFAKSLECALDTLKLLHTWAVDGDVIAVEEA